MDLVGGIEKQTEDDANALVGAGVVRAFRWRSGEEGSSESGDYIDQVLQLVGRQRPHVQLVVGFGCGWLSGYLFKAAVMTAAVAGGIALAVIVVKGYHVNWRAVGRNLREGAHDLSTSREGRMAVQSVSSTSNKMTTTYKFLTIGFGAGVLWSMFAFNNFWIM